MILIGLHGKAGAGKDTAAELLWKRWQLANYALATPIREGLMRMFRSFDLPAGCFHLPKLKEQPIPKLGKSPRELMQTLGTEWGRNMVHDRLWLMIAEGVIARVAEDARHDDVNGLVITDIRFPNEAEWMRRLGGEVWRIERDQCDAVRAHSSETPLPPALIDANINNNFDLDHLRMALDIEVERLLEGRKENDQQ